jgi:hypothetical protein
MLLEKAVCNRIFQMCLSLSSSLHALKWSIKRPNSTAFILDVERKECGLKVLLSISALGITLVIQFATVVGFTDAKGWSEESRYVKNIVWSDGRCCRTPVDF